VVTVAVTPEVDRYTQVFGALGDRFVMVRWRRVAGIDAAITAMNQDYNAKDAEMREAVHALFGAMESAPQPALSPAIQRRIAAIAELIAIGRTPIRRERDESVEYVPEAEGATRLAQQFCQLAKGSARLELRTDGEEQTDLAVVHRIALDTLPPQRAAVLRALIDGRDTASSGLKRHQLWRAVDDLKELDLLNQEGRLSVESRSLCIEAGPLTS
jgi:hypothetical protein